MIFNGLPESYKPFVVVVTQSNSRPLLRSRQHCVVLKTLNVLVFRRLMIPLWKRVLVKSAPMLLRLQQLVILAPVILFATHKCKQIGHIPRYCNRKKLWCSFCRKDSYTDSTCRSKGRATIVKKDQVQFANVTEDAEHHTFAFKLENSRPMSTILVSIGSSLWDFLLVINGRIC